MDRKHQRLEACFAVASAVLLAVSIALSLWKTQPQPLILRPLETTLNQPCRLDLNTATLPELESLPGIGPVIARRMVDWREENGAFTTPEDVLAVDGIGEATYETIEPYITFQ